MLIKKHMEVQWVPSTNLKGIRDSLSPPCQRGGDHDQKCNPRKAEKTDPNGIKENSSYRKKLASKVRRAVKPG
jgi:hypothetical protein